MRLLIDLQGALGGSRHSGLGRYSLEIALALAQTRGAHAVEVLLNDAFAAASAELGGRFAAMLGEGAVHRFAPPRGSHAGAEPHRGLRLAAEWLRADAVVRAAPDVVLVTSPFEGWNEPAVTTWPARLTRPRTVALLHDLIPLSRRADYIDGAWREAGLVNWYWRQIAELELMDGLLCNSEATREEGLSHLLRRPERFATIGAGVSAAFSAPPDAAAAPLEGRYLLCVGLGDIRKNEARLLQAVALLPQALRSGLRVAFTGRVAAGHVERLAAEAGLEPDVAVMLGTVPDAAMPALYRGAACCVVPSLTEGFGLPLAEAMAAGRPFAASRAGALPEVAQFPEALFDPLDPADMARVLARVLGEPAFAAALSAHGPRRAAAFAWPAVAARAWQALERFAGPAAPARPSLALTGPTQPSASGIADYTAELLAPLSVHYAITLVSPERPDAGASAGYPWMPPEHFAAAAWRFDRVLHQVGNHPLHQWQRAAIGLRPSVTLLHDVALSEYARRVHGEGTPALLGALWRNHGYPALLAALAGDAAMVTQSLPLSAEVLEGQLGTIVHSQAARAMLALHFGAGLAERVSVVPHLRRLPLLPAREAARARLGIAPDALVVAAFGGAVPKKLPQRVVAGFAAAGLRGARLVFAGEPMAGVAEMLRLEAGARRVGPALTVTGALSRPAYEDWLAAADIAVQLRARHQGESSGALADAMAAGLACVVNAEGSMAEVPPGAVLRLPGGFADAALGEAIGTLARDPMRRAALGVAARAWCEQALAPTAVAAQLAGAIEAAHAHAPALSLLRGLAGGAGLSSADAAALAEALEARFPPARQARLFVSAAAGWSRAVFAQARSGRRPEPVRLGPDGWASDHAGLAAALGLPRAAAADRRVFPGPGDAMAVGEAERHAVPPGVPVLPELGER